MDYRALTELKHGDLIYLDYDFNRPDSLQLLRADTSTTHTFRFRIVSRNCGHVLVRVHEWAVEFLTPGDMCGIRYPDEVRLVETPEKAISLYIAGLGTFLDQMRSEQEEAKASLSGPVAVEPESSPQSETAEVATSQERQKDTAHPAEPSPGSRRDGHCDHNADLTCVAMPHPSVLADAVTS